MALRAEDGSGVWMAVGKAEPRLTDHCALVGRLLLLKVKLS